MSWHKMAFCIAWYGIYCKVWWYRMPEFRSVLFLYSLFLKNQGNGKYWNWQFSMKMFFGLSFEKWILTICDNCTFVNNLFAFISQEKKKFCDNTMEKKFLLLQGVRFVPLCCDIPDLFQCTIDKKGIGTLLTVFFDLLGIDVDKTCSKRLCVTL